MKTTKVHHIDYWLLLAVVALLLFGILILTSVSTIFAQKKLGQTNYYLFHQLIFGILPGLIGGAVAFKISLPFLKKFAWPLLLMNLFSMLLVFAPKIGVAAGGASRWIDLGFVSFQPSEVLKFTFILYLATWLANRTGDESSRNGKKEKFTTLLPFFIVVGVVGLLLLFQSDLSTLGIISVVAFCMYFSARTPIWHNLLLIATGVAAVIGFVIFERYRFERLMVFLNVAKDPMGIGYQVSQILIAVGSGGIFGVGLGMSTQKLGFVPQTMTDSIFAIFSEELGFAGAFVLVALFLWLLWQGLKISKNSPDMFSKLFSLGIIVWISLQALINLGSNTGILPLVGIPLPFISYGGSHMIAELVGIGFLLNISRRTADKKT